MTLPDGEERDQIDVDSLEGRTTSPETKSVNVPGGKAIGGTSSPIENETPLGVMTRTNECDPLTNVAEKKVEEAKKGVEKAKKEVENAKKEVAKAGTVTTAAKEAAVAAEVSAKKISENPVVAEPTKKQAVALANKAKQDLKDAVSNENKVVGKKEMLDKAVAKAEKAVEEEMAVQKNKAAQQKKETITATKPSSKKSRIIEQLDPKQGITVQTEYQGYCVGFFPTDGDTKVMGMCAVTPEGKCPAVWNETRCVKLQPVKTSVFETPTTPLW